MPTSLVDADSLLTVDIGSVTTRAALFDVVDGRYRFLAAGSAPSTANAPFNDVSEGVRLAIDRLQTVTGRKLIGPDELLIMPSKANGSGVDTFAATLSAGPPLRVVAVGLLEEVSLESARRLATTGYARVIESISLNDRRKPETRIDTIMRLRPDLILAAGGTEGGASQSVLKLLESVGLACFLLPDGYRPEVLFAGNQELQDEVQATLGKLVPVHFTSNLRPTLEAEQLEAAQSEIASLYRLIRARQISGVQEINNWSGGGLMPTASAFGRIIRFLSKVYDSAKGVLGIDLGASTATVAAGFNGDLKIGVYPQYGLGSGLGELLQDSRLEEITRWLHLEIPDLQVREYLMNKAFYPASLPATEEDLDIEQAAARQIMRLTVKKLLGSFPQKAMRYGPGLLPWFEPIVAMGGVLTRAPNFAQAMLMLLDGLQPTGVTTLVLDQNHISPSLGAVAAVNPLLSVQVLETSTFMNLGTVVSPVVNVRPGTPVVRVRMTPEGGSETNVEVKQGSLELLPLPVGQGAKLQLTPLHRADVGMGGAGRGGGLRVVGGALGVVIDARGRPLRVAEDPTRRHEQIKKWRWTLGC
jgi:hypothetical protein